MLKYSKFHICIIVCVLSHIWLFTTPWTVEPARLLCPCDCPGKDTEVGCCFLLQGDLPNSGMEHISRVSCIGRQILYHCTIWNAQFFLRESIIIFRKFKIRKKVFCIFLYIYHFQFSALTCIVTNIHLVTFSLCPKNFI